MAGNQNSGGRSTRGRRALFCGNKGQKCWNINCQASGAVWLNVNNRKYYCKKCAEMFNIQAENKSLAPVCVDYECKNLDCHFWDSRFELNCSAWGLTEIKPIDCLNRQRRGNK